MKIIVILMGLINIITGTAGFLVGLALIAGGAMLVAGAGSAAVGVVSVCYGVVFAAVSGLWIVFGAGIINLRKWARNCMIGTAIILIPFSIWFAFKEIANTLFLLLCAAYLFFLNHPKMKEMFK